MPDGHHVCGFCGSLRITRNGSRQALVPRICGDRLRWEPLAIQRLKCRACRTSVELDAEILAANAKARAFAVRYAFHHGIASAAAACGIVNKTMTCWIEDWLEERARPPAIGVRSLGVFAMTQSIFIADADQSRLLDVVTADITALRGSLDAMEVSCVEEVAMNFDRHLRDLVNRLLPHATVHIPLRMSDPLLNSALETTSVGHSRPESILLKESVAEQGWTANSLRRLRELLQSAGARRNAVALDMWMREIETGLAVRSSAAWLDLIPYRSHSTSLEIRLAFAHGSFVTRARRGPTAIS